MDKRFDLLPKEMKQAIKALQDLHNVPDEMALQAVLGTVNLAVQCHYDVDSAIYGQRPTSLFLVAMVPTGGLKSTIMREVSRGIELFKDEQKRLLANDELRFKLQQKKYEQQEKQYLKEIEVDPYAELPIPPKPVETFNYLVSKGTLNGLIDILRNQSFLGLFSSEAGEFFNAHSFQKNNINGAIEMCASMTKMWDGDVIERVTGENKTHLWHRRVMMCFLLQTEVFEEILNNRVFSEQGFIHRLLLTQTESFEKLDWDLTPGSKERMAAKRQQLERFDQTIYTIIRQTQRRRSDRGFELEPAVITQSDDAYQILGDFRNANKNRAQEDLREYAGFAERLHEHALRIAATIAVFDHFEQNLDKADAEPFDLRIRAEHAVAAVDLIDFYCEQRRQLELGVQDLNPVHTTGSQRLMVWIREKAWTGTQRELSQIGPAWFRKLGRDQRIKMLQDLVSDDLLTATEITAGNGRKTWQFSVATQGQSSSSVATASTVI